MSRYRPPSPPKSPYITAAGMLMLQQEEKALWPRRREVVAALSAAAAEGDRSENAEYIYRKKELRELDRRIRYLQIRLPELKVVNSIPSNTQQVFFGATVHLQDTQSEIRVYRIVGPDEFDQQPHYISMDSPLARALLKRELGEEIMVQVPGGEQHYLIVEIEYR
ncbi:MAG: transcription elongation factor GreB [Gammaproteobacteria bacterium]|nr:transcription elongation factor GreB [Gammaproteobacteria bacterium]MBL6999791.1 transcription elongation factor GreB [Gammaproteobacteria bacterium]